MKIKPIREITEEIIGKYNNNPNNWYILKGKSDFPEILVCHEGVMWLLKRDTLFSPNYVGVGARMDVEKEIIEKEIKREISFGLRPVSEESIKDLIFSNKPKRIVSEMINNYPMSYKEAGCTKGPFIEGPVGQLGMYPDLKPVPVISSEQIVLDRKLSDILNKLVGNDMMYR